MLSAISLVSNGLEKEMERVRMEMHRQRGEEFAPPTPESVEWLNSFVKVVWGLVVSFFLSYFFSLHSAVKVDVLDGRFVTS